MQFLYLRNHRLGWRGLDLDGKDEGVECSDSGILQQCVERRERVALCNIVSLSVFRSPGEN